MKKIKEIMSGLSEKTPDEIGGFKVKEFKNFNNGTIEGFPKSNVLYYDLEDNAWLCIRPSGTEPKIKFYYEVKGENEEQAKLKSEELKKGLHDLMKEYL